MSERHSLLSQDERSMFGACVPRFCSVDQRSRESLGPVYAEDCVTTENLSTA